MRRAMHRSLAATGLAREILSPRGAGALRLRLHAPYRKWQASSLLHIAELREGGCDERLAERDKVRAGERKDATRSAIPAIANRRAIAGSHRPRHIQSDE